MSKILNFATFFGSEFAFIEKDELCSISSYGKLNNGIHVFGTKDIIECNFVSNLLILKISTFIKSSTGWLKIIKCERKEDNSGVVIEYSNLTVQEDEVLNGIVPGSILYFCQGTEAISVGMIRGADDDTFHSVSFYYFLTDIDSDKNVVNTYFSSCYKLKDNDDYIFNDSDTNYINYIKKRRLDKIVDFLSASVRKCDCVVMALVNDFDAKHEKYVARVHGILHAKYKLYVDSYLSKVIFDLKMRADILQKEKDKEKDKEKEKDKSSPINQGSSPVSPSPSISVTKTGVIIDSDPPASDDEVDEANDNEEVPVVRVTTSGRRIKIIKGKEYISKLSPVGLFWVLKTPISIAWANVSVMDVYLHNVNHASELNMHHDVYDIPIKFLLWLDSIVVGWRSSFFNDNHEPVTTFNSLMSKICEKVKSIPGYLANYVDFNVVSQHTQISKSEKDVQDAYSVDIKSNGASVPIINTKHESRDEKINKKKELDKKVRDASLVKESKKFSGPVIDPLAAFFGQHFARSFSTPGALERYMEQADRIYQSCVQLMSLLPYANENGYIRYSTRRSTIRSVTDDLALLESMPDDDVYYKYTFE